MEILYWAIGVVTGAVGVLMCSTYKLYQEYQHALRFIENCGYLLQMKSCCVKHGAEGVHVAVELDGIQLSQKRMKYFESFVLHVMNGDERGPTIISMRTAEESTEPFVPYFDANKLHEWLSSSISTAIELMQKYHTLNIVSKLFLRRTYNQLDEQYDKIQPKSYELAHSDERFVCFFN